ncbi:uncharacterized protein LOC133193676 isoform X2 [Saccostrea echinata]|uniref:uncharacterized protein LOC133193676 isoform X2 n=1 Tax=Saccostrea echinata TaxID=191078 RepID=UPI002A80C091|nr:uncharacterized protein LOC133193676 isoform X2 [Saccostrea echinata]
MIVLILILLTLLCSFCQPEEHFVFGHFGLDTNTYNYHLPTVGNNNLTLGCTCTKFQKNIIPSVTLRFLQNKSTHWRYICMANVTGFYWLNKNKTSEFFFANQRCGYHDHYGNSFCGLWLYYLFTLRTCSVDPDFTPVFQCYYTDDGSIFKSHEMRVFSIKGQSPKMLQGPTIIRGRTKNNTELYRVGDVIQLQCVGEIESINGIPSENIKWCKKTPSGFRELKLQEPPLTTPLSSSEDGCTHVQKSEIFYHLTQTDEELEIICIAGDRHSRECGQFGIRSNILIKARTEVDGIWRMPPIIIYDSDGLINPQNIRTYGTGKIIYLFCSASMVSTSKEEVMTCCVKKGESNEKWTKIRLQEDEMYITLNNSAETVQISRITYHVTEYDNVVHFLCEMSTSSMSTCGSGSRSINLPIYFNSDEIPNRTATLENKVTTTASPTVSPPRSTEHQGNSTVIVLAALTVLLCVLLTLVVLFVFKTYRRGDTTLFGFIIKIERSKY